MVEKRNCSFCGEAIEPGTGKMYIKKDGTVFNFCSNKCKKNNINLERVSRRTRWTTRYAELKASTLIREKSSTEEPAAEEKPVKKAPAKPKTEKPAAKKTEEKAPVAKAETPEPAIKKPAKKAAPAKKKEAPAKE